MAQKLINHRPKVALISDDSGEMHRIESGESRVVDLNHSDAPEYPGIEFQDTDEQPTSVVPREVYAYAEITNVRPRPQIIDMGDRMVRLDPDESVRLQDVDKGAVYTPGTVVKELTEKEFSQTDRDKALEKQADIPKYFDTPEEFREWAFKAPFRVLQLFSRRRGIVGSTRERIYNRLRKAMFGDETGKSEEE